MLDRTFVLSLTTFEQDDPLQSTEFEPKTEVKERVGEGEGEREKKVELVAEVEILTAESDPPPIDDSRYLTGIKLFLVFSFVFPRYMNIHLIHLFRGFLMSIFLVSLDQVSSPTLSSFVFVSHLILFFSDYCELTFCVMKHYVHLSIFTKRSPLPNRRSYQLYVTKNPDHNLIPILYF
jgi:hypothetical protein